MEGGGVWVSYMGVGGWITDISARPCKVLVYVKIFEWGSCQRPSEAAVHTKKEGGSERNRNRERGLTWRGGCSTSLRRRRRGPARASTGRRGGFAATRGGA